LLPHVGLGDLYATAERNPRAAADEYRKALAIKPDYHPARLGLGLALLAGGDRAGALAELQRLAKDTPGDPTAWHLIGRIHASEKRYGEAVKALTEALRVQPDFLPALVDRADVYAAADEDRKAAADYEQVLKRQSGDAVSRVKLGMIYQRLGDTDRAAASYRAALKTNPDLPPAANNLAMIELRRGRNLDEALALSRKAVALAPEVPQFHDTLGQVLQARGDQGGAIAATEKATTLKPPQADIWYHLGRLYEDAGRKDPAVKAYRRALEIDPKFKDASAARSRLQALGAK
jgi:tetratricopeptide (TPR) repeat protein